jgi:hypothetical protein
MTVLKSVNSKVVAAIFTALWRRATGTQNTLVSVGAPPSPLHDLPFVNVYSYSRLGATVESPPHTKVVKGSLDSLSSRNKLGIVGKLDTSQKPNETMF